MKTGAVTDLVQDYVQGVEYLTTNVNPRRLEAVYHAEGRRYNVNVNVSNTESIRLDYWIRDHLGNTRISFTDKNNDGKIDVYNTSSNEILQEGHYYPFGMAFEGPIWMNDATDIDNRYKYNGKEYQSEHGLNWYAYGARYYDPMAGRFTGVDPLADKFQYLTPYNYAINNPEVIIDLEGRAPEWIYDQQNDGSWKRREGVNNDGGDKNHSFVFKNGDVSYYSAESGKMNTIKSGSSELKLNEYREKIAQIRNTGEDISDVGDGIAGAGYVAAPFTEGASLSVSAIGESVSLVGKAISNIANLEKSGVTKDNMINLSVDAVTELAPLPIEGLIKKSNFDNVSKDIIKSEVRKVKMVMEYIANEKIKNANN